jgi:hypothetical protein
VDEGFWIVFLLHVYNVCSDELYTISGSYRLYGGGELSGWRCVSSDEYDRVFF